ncbi:nucleotidyltransferase family protein [Streptomyces sp. NPDC087300]|uniref:nucleotidyltransferase domain-containing protein n=1 Tax=Streptomyces sp. NPDC087300 TaxID=3365780 RepID=UPI003806094F
MTGAVVPPGRDGTDIPVRTGLSGLRPEAHLLIALARLRIDRTGQGAIRGFLTRHGAALDWGFFLDQAARHMVLPLVGRNLVRLRLTHGDDGRSLVPYHWIYAAVYEGNRRRNTAFAAEFAKVFRALAEAGIDYAVRKGPVLGEGVYLDRGARRMSDLDVLLRRADFALFGEIAAEQGYTLGQQSADGRRIEPFDRRTQVYWKVNITNVALPYIKLGHQDDLDQYILSGCFSLFQPMSGIRDDGEELLDRAVPTRLYGEPARMLDPVDQLIDGCVQIHVEANLLLHIENGKDLALRKFIDLAELLRLAPEGCLPEFEKRVAGYGCEESVAYALHRTDELYPGSVPASLISRFPVSRPELLEEYGRFDGAPRCWEMPFAERLFDPRRSHVARGRSQVPGPRSSI